MLPVQLKNVLLLEAILLEQLFTLGLVRGDLIDAFLASLVLVPSELEHVNLIGACSLFSLAD